MKKIFLYITVILAGLFITACDEDVEVWDSATLDYSGRYVVAVQSEDQSATYAEIQMDVFNTAKNLSDEMWIQDLDDLFPLQAKIFIEGNTSSFKSKSMNFDDLGDNINAITVPETAPTADGQSVTEDRYYIRCGLVDGKVIANAATTIGGNTADSLYMKIRLLSGTVTFKSFSVPVALRADPDKEEFAWEFDSMVYDDALDETYVLSGHRYTGFPEDDH